MRVDRSSGNVFRGLNQGQAAKLLGVTQPRISALLRGKIQLFSVDGLMAMLGRGGARVSVTVKQQRGRVA